MRAPRDKRRSDELFEGAALVIVVEIEFTDTASYLFRVIGAAKFTTSHPPKRSVSHNQLSPN
jgi:hypothetical protein